MNGSRSRIAKIYKEFALNIDVDGSDFGAYTEEASAVIDVDVDTLVKYAEEMQDDGNYYEAIFLACVSSAKSSSSPEKMRMCANSINASIQGMQNEGNPLDNIKKNIIQVYHSMIRNVKSADGDNETKVVAVADIWTMIGILHSFTDDASSDIAANEKAKRIMETIPEPQRYYVYSDCYYNKARALSKMGMYREAIENFTAAKTFREESKDKDKDENYDIAIPFIDQNIEYCRSEMDLIEAEI